MRKDCPICRGCGWVCVDHPTVAWDEGKGCGCGAEGMACECNPDAEMPPGTEIKWSADRGWRQ